MTVILPDEMSVKGLDSVAKIVEAGTRCGYVAKLDNFDVLFYDPKVITWYRRNLKKLPSWAPIYKAILVLSSTKPFVVLSFKKQDFIDGVALAHGIADTGADVKMEIDTRGYTSPDDMITDLEETRRRTETEINKLENALRIVTAML
ncbi:MAG: hypothetical protein JRN66_07080 [Nitrososphaerota archaeon]|nr:hypothetical protein [Nitrososphaerota archaeon]